MVWVTSDFRSLRVENRWKKNPGKKEGEYQNAAKERLQARLAIITVS